MTPLRLLLLVLCLVAAPTAAAPQYPALTGRVVDEAGLLSPTGRAALEAKLADFERARSVQVVVATVPSLQGYGIEEYGVGLGRAWGIGEKGKNNGVVLLVAPKEREVRIEVGYGLEGTLTDALTSAIIRERIIPQFRVGGFEAGIFAGVDGILAVLDPNYVPSEPAAAPVQRSKEKGSPYLGLLILPLWLIAMFYFRRHRRFYYYGGLGGFGGSRGGGGGGFSSGGGFSGGGGSFGGGGASGRW